MISGYHIRQSVSIVIRCRIARWYSATLLHTVMSLYFVICQLTCAQLISQVKSFLLTPVPYCSPGDRSRESWAGPPEPCPPTTCRAAALPCSSQPAVPGSYASPGAHRTGFALRNPAPPGAWLVLQRTEKAEAMSLQSFTDKTGSNLRW